MSKSGHIPVERIIPIHLEGSDTLSASTSSGQVQTSQELSSTSQQQEETQQDVITQCNEETDEIITPSLIDEESSPKIMDEIPSDRVLPFYNVREKIIIVLDRAEDDHYTPFSLSNNITSPPLLMLKKSLQMFLKWKASINRRHEFALVVLDENNATWCLDFTNSVDEVMNKLCEVTSCEAEDIFDLNSLFSLLLEHVTLPAVKHISLPPQYIVRTILLYNRSYTLPQITLSEKIENLLNSPYFTLDVLMTHEPIDSDNNCNKIFQVLQNLDKKGFAYFFSVARNLRCLLSSMGILLSHPLQRPFKKFAEYNIKDVSG